MRRLRLAPLLAVLALAVSPTSAAHAAGPLQTAIDHSGYFSDRDLRVVYGRIRAAGATHAKIVLSWRLTAPPDPSRPAGFDAANPFDKRYRWGNLDDEVSLALEHGLQPFITIKDAPAWAERGGGGRGGTNQPDAAEFGLFAEAVARRYSGGFAGLPRVRAWEAWNEPNASFFLYPQRSGDQIVSPDLYRRMVNEFAAGIHRVHPDNDVIAGATFPFTIDRGNVQTIGPLQFMRRLFCLSNSNRPLPNCGEPVQLDVWSHHPYTAGGPTHHGGNPYTVSIRELPRMRNVLRAAVRYGRIASSRRVRFWVSEFSWDSNPPDPGGVPMRLLSRWVSEALYRMWKADIEVVTWFKLRDDGRDTPDEPNSSIFQSGFYFRCDNLGCDRPKRSLRAFKFPFVAFRSGRSVYVWGRTRNGKPSRVKIEQRVGDRWRRLAQVRANRYGIFSRRVHTRRRGALRARGSGSSLPFSLKRPPDRPVNPFG